jgi:uncharacterized protein YjdB
MQQRGLVLALAAIITIAACDDDASTPPGTVTSVAITGAPASFAVTRTATLTATAVVTNGAPSTVTWSTSSAAIATVAATGNTATITAVAPGSVTITAASAFDPTKTATATITVVSQILRFSAALSPANEPPGLLGNPTGSGTYTAQLDTITNAFTWTGSFSGLTSNISNGHIHGPFVVGGTTTTAGVLVNFSPQVTVGATFTGLGSANAGAVTGTQVLNTAFQATGTVNGDSVRKLVIAGNTYVNIHTSTNPGGEVRGQLLRVP